MKIVITGGAGFIGSHIVDKYVEQGHDVVILDNLSTGRKENINPKATFFKIDIREKKEVDKVFQQFKPEILNHHAAQLDVRKSVANPTYDAQVNIVGLLNLLEAGRRNNLKKVVFASSGGVVYGDAKKIPTPEGYHPLQPLSPYGVSKLASEHYLYYYYKAYNISYLALRYANVYGPRQDPYGEAGVVAIFTQKLLKGQNTIINGDGNQTRDYVFVSDVVDANILATQSEYIGSLNVGTGTETSVNDIFKLLVFLTNSKASEKYGPSKIGEQQRSVLDITTTKKLLGWAPKYTLSQGMNKTVEFFKNQP